MASDCTAEGSLRAVPRSASVDCFRVVAMFIVVCMHANFIARLHMEGGGYGFAIDFPLNLLWWLTVPYFLLVAGYFYGQKVQAGYQPVGLLLASCISLGWLYVIWSLVYSLMPQRWTWRVSDQSIWQTFSSESVLSWATGVSEHIRLYLMPWHAYYHLWFLPVIAIGLATVALVTMVRLKRSTVLVLVALYVLMVIAEVVLPREGTRGSFVSAALLGMFFTLLGWWLSHRRPLSIPMALGLIIGGGALAVTEGIVLKLVFQATSDQISHYPYAGAALLILGVFILLLSKPTWGQNTLLPALARFTLGVYVCHILVEHMLTPLRDQLRHLSVLWYILYVIAVYALSVLLTWAMMQMPGLRLLVVRDKALPDRLRRQRPGIGREDLYRAG